MLVRVLDTNVHIFDVVGVEISPSVVPGKFWERTGQDYHYIQRNSFIIGNETGNNTNTTWTRGVPKKCEAIFGKLLMIISFFTIVTNIIWFKV